jgi:hypothetical protein
VSGWTKKKQTSFHVKQNLDLEPKKKIHSFVAFPIIIFLWFFWWRDCVIVVIALFSWKETIKNCSLRYKELLKIKFCFQSNENITSSISLSLKGMSLFSFSWFLHFFLVIFMNYSIVILFHSFWNWNWNWNFCSHSLAISIFFFSSITFIEMGNVSFLLQEIKEFVFFVLEKCHTRSFSLNKIFKSRLSFCFILFEIEIVVHIHLQFQASFSVQITFIEIRNALHLFQESFIWLFVRFKLMGRCCLFNEMKELCMEKNKYEYRNSTSQKKIFSDIFKKSSVLRDIKHLILLTKNNKNEELLPCNHSFERFFFYYYNVIWSLLIS